MESQKRKCSSSDSSDIKGGKMSRLEPNADVSAPVPLTVNDQTTDHLSNNKNVILHAQNQRGVAEKHASDLEKNGIVAVLRLCKDVQSFKEMTLESFKRLDILVDTSMCAMLMNGEELHDVAKIKFKEMNNANTKVWIVNKFAEDFEQLYHCLPRNIREKWEEELPSKHVDTITNTGHSGGLSKSSNVMGSNNGNSSVINLYLHENRKYKVEKEEGESTIEKIMSSQTVDTEGAKNSDKNKMQVSINGEKEEICTAIVNDQDKLKTGPVRDVKVRNGSIIITLTLEDGHTITEQWIESILRTIFDDILSQCTSKGDVFHVTVETTHLRLIQLVNGLQRNVISTDEFQRYQESMKVKVENLEDELQKMRQYGQTDETGNKTEDDPLLLDSYNGKLDQLKKSLTKEPQKIDIRGRMGRTPVMLAVSTGNKKVVELLKEAGCDMEILDYYGNNILHVACIGGVTDMVKYILSLNMFDINKKGENGKTPIMIAAFMGHEEVFDLLLGEGCDTSGVDASSDNILHLACLGGSQRITTNIVDNDLADLNSTGALGRTPVMKAAGKCYSDLVQFLINKESDLTAIDGEGNNVLHISCLGGSLEVVQGIVSKTVVDNESKGNHDWSPIMMAAEQGHYRIFRFLAEKGCDMSHEDPLHNNIFHLAAIGGNEDIVKYLLENHVPGTKKHNKFGKMPIELWHKELNANLVASLA